MNLLSLFPTLLELCGLPPQADHDGPSLVPLLHDPSKGWPDASLTHLAEPGSVAISSEGWRYIHYAKGGEELYDVNKDPYEWNNLAESPEHSSKLAELRHYLPEQFVPIPLPAVPK